MKYLFDLFVPCSSFSETNMLLAKTSFFDFLSLKTMFFLLSLILGEKK